MTFAESKPTRMSRREKARSWCTRESGFGTAYNLSSLNSVHMIFAGLLCYLMTCACYAATRFVAINGKNEGEALSWDTAWRTIAYAAANADNGDTIVIGPGEFNEYVHINSRTNLTFFSSNNAVTCAFRVTTPSNTFSGLRLLSAQNENVTWNAFFRIEPSAHWTTISNCVIGDSPQAKATNFVFDADLDIIYSPDVDFVRAGFRTNAQIFWAGCSLSNLWFANMCKAGIIVGVETNKLYIQDGCISLKETNRSAWSYIFPGANYNGVSGVHFAVSAYAGATNCTIIRNLFTNLVGVAIDLNGYNHRIHGNEIVRQIGNSGLQIKGANHVIMSNYIHDCIVPIYYSAYELNKLVYHPPGGGFYDFVAGFIHDTGSWSTYGNSNIVIAWNWFENIEQPLGQQRVTNPAGGFRGLNVLSNVFIGFVGPWSGGWNDLNISYNTFYRCAYNEGFKHVLYLGGNGITNVTVTYNAFLDCGDHSSLGSEGGFSLVNCYGNINTNGNVILGPEVAGNRLRLRDENRPRGADGRPFTADDGLAPLPGSPVCGVGALGVAIVTPGQPIAHFTVRDNLGWAEPTGSNYNPAWQAMSAPLRRGVMRPYTNGAPVAKIPQTVTFVATNSISGTWSTNDWKGIQHFLWDFGDGSRPVWTPWPDVSHTFLTTGQFTMTLWVTNTAGNVAAVSRVYSVWPNEESSRRIYYVSRNGDDSNPGTYTKPFSSITKALSAAVAGDYVAVLSGNFVDPINLATCGAKNGTLSLPITVVGYNVALQSVYQTCDWWTWEGFEFLGTNIQTGLSAFFTTSGECSGITLRNNWFHDGLKDYAAVLFAAKAKRGGTDYLVVNNVFERIAGGAHGVIKLIGQTNVVIDANICKETSRQGDFVQFNGWNIVIRRNWCYNLGGDNHPDFVQLPTSTSGSEPVWIPTGNVLIERNWVQIDDQSENVQICQMATMTNGSPEFTNIVFRNNVFIGFPGGMNMKCDGDKIHNNLFYRCSSWYGHVIASGGGNGSTYALDIRNNIFYECGTNRGIAVGTGWYQNGLYPWQTNVTMVADYNFVCGSNYAAKALAPPNDAYHWAIQGQEARGINGGNPRFANVAQFDFRLLSDSPLLGAGANLSAYFTDDFFGETRSDAWTIGPFQGSADRGSGWPTTIVGPRNLRVVSGGIR